MKANEISFKRVGTRIAEAARDNTKGKIGRRYVTVGENLSLPDKVDWSNEPSQFKLYSGLPKTALGYESPTSTTQRQERCPQPLTIEQTGQLLCDVYGLARQRWTALSPTGLSASLVGTPSAVRTSLGLGMLRSVPSGGARFPCELYLLVGSGQSIPQGVHHYDPAHHMLHTLQSEDPMSTLSAHSASSSATSSELALVLSIVFWKNAFKYGEFSYRLQSLDAGVLIGQSLAVAERYGLRPTVRYKFVDHELDCLLGLDPMHESVYAIVDLQQQENQTPATRPQSLTKAFPVLHEPAAIRSIASSLPLLAELHRASMSPTSGLVPSETSLAPIIHSAPKSRRSLELVDCGTNLLEGLHRRRSSMGYFRLSKLTWRQLSQLLAAAAQGYPSDLDSDPPSDPPSVQHTLLFCVINHVEGVAPGVYYYCAERHTLEQVYAADVSAELQATLTFNTTNLHHASIAILPAADYESGFSVHGDRWYRMQNMEAGISVQRLYLAAAALGLGCHVTCAYRVDRANALLGFAEDSVLTNLAQVLIAPGREPGYCYEHTL